MRESVQTQAGAGVREESLLIPTLWEIRYAGNADRCRLVTIKAAFVSGGGKIFIPFFFCSSHHPCEVIFSNRLRCFHACCFAAASFYTKVLGVAGAGPHQKDAFSCRPSSLPLSRLIWNHNGGRVFERAFDSCTDTRCDPAA